MNRVCAFSVAKTSGILLALAAFTSASLLQSALLRESQDVQEAAQEKEHDEPIPLPTPPPTLSPEETALEQTSQGARPVVPLVESFDGLGAGFQGPQGTSNFRNPSDN